MRVICVLVLEPARLAVCHSKGCSVNHSKGCSVKSARAGPLVLSWCLHAWRSVAASRSAPLRNLILAHRSRQAAPALEAVDLSKKEERMRVEEVVVEEVEGEGETIRPLRVLGTLPLSTSGPNRRSRRAQLSGAA